jgi:hypothetical protein
MTNGLMGHLNSANESDGVRRGFRFMPDTTASWVAKMASPLLSADMYARGGQAGLINRDFRDERSLVAAVVVPFRTLCDRSQRSLPAVG